jgi:LysR family transcriptional regulator, glycine cleavage system transcriptional activator
MSEQLPLNALRVFEAVARTGSFTRAAEELFITQSAVSHQVKALEEWLGAPLFQRSRRTPSLLASGAALAPVLTGALSDIQNACRRLREKPSVQRLTIAVIPSIATCWLIPRLSEFRRKHPDIGLRIVYAIHGQLQDFHDADLVITYSAERPKDKNVSLFMDAASAPVCSTSFAQENGSFENSATMARAQFLHDTDFSGWQQWFRRAGSSTPALDHSLVFEDFNLLRAATLAGQGISLCPVKLIADDLKTGRLIQISNVMVSEDSGYYVKAASSPQTEQRKVFGEWLMATADDT